LKPAAARTQRRGEESCSGREGKTAAPRWEIRPAPVLRRELRRWRQPIALSRGLVEADLRLAEKPEHEEVGAAARWSFGGSGASGVR
jgi:hypothetical protein